jgi:pSer/pThr/pTyr-binding forkhead associated (FHA) protein
MSLLIDDELVIGRLAEGAGRLADDDEISRSHARLSMDARGLCAIEDLGSTNGTFVNGMRITSPQTLSEGDTVELGATTLVVREIPAVAEEPTAAEPVPAPPQKTVVPGDVQAAASPAQAPEAPVSEAPAPEAPAPAFDEPVAEPVAPAAEAVAPAAEAGAPTFDEPVAAPAAPVADAPVDAAVAGAPVDAAPPPPLSLHLDIDLAAREVRIRIADEAEPVRLVYEGDAWRPASSLSSEKGN